MPKSTVPTFTNPTTPWGAAHLLNPDGPTALSASLGFSAFMKGRVANADAAADLGSLGFTAFTKTLPAAASATALGVLTKWPVKHTSDYASLDAMIVALGAGPYVVHVDAAIACAANTVCGSGIHFLFEPGASITVNNAVTLTINSPGHVHAAVQEQTIFVLTGTGLVAFTNPGTIYPGWWGASPASAAAVNTAALNAAAAALVGGCEFHLPGGVYLTNDVVEFANVNFVRIMLAGEIRNNTAGTDGVSFTSVNESEIYLAAVSRVPTDWVGSDKAILLNGPFSHNKLWCLYALGYVYGIYCDALDDTGVGYWDFWIGRMEYCKYHLYFKTHNGGSWVGAGVVHSGSFTNGASAGADDWAVYCDRGVGAIHSISFCDGKYEALGNGIYAQGAHDLVIRGSHWEMIAHTEIDLTNTQNATIELCAMATAWEVMTVLWGSGTRGIIVHQAAKVGSGAMRTILLDAVAGGFTWLEVNDPRMAVHSDFYVARSYGCLFWQDQAGGYAFFDKCYESATGEPAAGNYRVGSVCWKIPWVSGTPSYKVCTAEGTMGTLVGVTADTTLGSNDIVVNDVTNLRYSNTITVAGGSTLVGRKITGIVGTTVTVGGAAEGNAVAGQAVSFVAATWAAGPNNP